VEPQVATPTRFSRFVATTANAVAFPVRRLAAAFNTIARRLTRKPATPGPAHSNPPKKPDFTPS
jgi:hypothetical protein